MDEFKIHELFACPIFIKDLNLNNFELEKYALNLKDKQSNNQRSNRGGFQSDFLPYKEEPILLSLSNSIDDCLNHYKNFLGFKKDLEVELDNMWININDVGGYHVVHTHPNSIFSGVYYISAPVNSGNINFEHPSLDTMQYDWRDEYKDILNEVNSENWYIPALSGRLLLFPSWLKHSVSQNLVKENRISLSFNAHIGGK
jgi:uncharacterized protein (TIGR02466 family)